MRGSTRNWLSINDLTLLVLLLVFNLRLGRSRNHPPKIIVKKYYHSKYRKGFANIFDVNDFTMASFRCLYF